jgi:hypothetical protein
LDHRGIKGRYQPMRGFKHILSRSVVVLSILQSICRTARRSAERFDYLINNARHLEPHSGTSPCNNVARPDTLGAGSLGQHRGHAGITCRHRPLVSRTFAEFAALATMERILRDIRATGRYQRPFSPGTEIAGCRNQPPASPRSVGNWYKPAARVVTNSPIGR